MGKPLVDKEREESLIKDRTMKFTQKGINDPYFVEKLFRLIIEESLKIEKAHLKSLHLK